ncbi:MAG: RHS repeat domain-containing protein [Pirellula sp.]
MSIHSHLPFDQSTSHARIPAGGINLIASIDSVSEAQFTASFFGSTKALHGEVATTSPATSTHNHSNQQYSVTAVTTSAGAIAERYAYSAYGEPTTLNGSGSAIGSSSISNRYSYTGREWDSTVGLYHFRARWMSPKTGRFLGRDPIAFEGSEWNLYELFDGHVLVFADPFGLAGDSVTTWYENCAKDFASHKNIDKMCDCICAPADPSIGGRPGCTTACKKCIKMAPIQNPCKCMCKEFNDWINAQECMKKCDDKLNTCDLIAPHMPKCGGPGAFVLGLGEAVAEGGCGRRVNSFDAHRCPGGANSGGVHYKYRKPNGCFFTVLCCPCCADIKGIPGISQRCKFTG